MSDPILPALQAALGTTYTIRSEIGGGGMSRVFIAEDHRFRRDVVVKVLPPALAQGMLVDRFRREIMFAAQLQHPNVVPVLASGEADGLPYYVMPYIAGESLKTRLQRGPLSVREAGSVMRDVARALGHAHGRGLVHRDIKPGNILLTANAATVADFGVAKALAASSKHDGPGGASTTMTDVGSSLGTPAYMAPEQVAADPTIDHRADLYALGVVAFEMLCGAPPFAGRTARAMMAAHLAEQPPRVDARRGDVPPAMADLIATLLEKDPDRRPRNADSVIRALDDTSFGNPADSSMRGVRGKKAGPNRRRLAMAAAAGAILLASVLAMVFVRGADEAATGQARGVTTVVVGAPELFSGTAPARAFVAGLPAEVATRLSRLENVEVLMPVATPVAAGGADAGAAVAPRYRVVSLVQDGAADSAAAAAAAATTAAAQARRTPPVPRLHAVVRLVDDRTGRVLWAESISFPVDSLVPVQSRLAYEVAGAVTRQAPAPAQP